MGQNQTMVFWLGLSAVKDRSLVVNSVISRWWGGGGAKLQMRHW